MSTFANSEDPDEMQHNDICCISSWSSLFVKVKKNGIVSMWIENLFMQKCIAKQIT